MGDATNGHPVASSTSDFVQEMTTDALLSDDEHALHELLVFAKQPRGAVDVGRLVRSCVA